MRKIGLMGCGMVAGYGHIPALLEVPDLRLHALFDPEPENLRKAQEKFGVPEAFTDPEAFFRSGIEAVSITSPAPCHRQNVLDVARASPFVGFCYRFSHAEAGGRDNSKG